MTDPLAARRAAAKQALAAKIVDQLAELGVSRELATGVVQLHVKFNTCIDRPEDVGAQHDGALYIDEPRSLLDLARVLADAYLNKPLHTTRTTNAQASPLAQQRRNVASAF